MHAAVAERPVELAPGKGNSESSVRLDCLQMLRGIAAAMVLAYHTGSLYAVHTGQVLWGNVFRAGFTGVEVFFVLSGVVIYWVHVDDVGRPERARNFLIRRGFRLFPVYWLVVFLKMAKDPAAVSLGTLLTAVLLLPAAPPFINVSWTLTYELLFYSAFLLWIVLPKTRVSAWPMLLLVALAVCPVPDGLASGTLQVWASFVFNPHLAVFVLGVMVAWHLRRAGPLPLRFSVMLVVLGLAAFLAAAGWGTWLASGLQGDLRFNAHDVAELRSNWVFDAGVWLFGVPAAAAVAGLLSLELRGRLRVPARRVLTWLGDVSYSLYLTHAFVIHLALSHTGFKAMAIQQPIVLLSVWALALLIAWGLYRVVEVPAMRWGRRFATAPRL